MEWSSPPSRRSRACSTMVRRSPRRELDPVGCVTSGRGAPSGVRAARRFADEHEEDTVSGGWEGGVGVARGGGGGMGRECARRFVAEGARVVLADRNAEPLRAAVAELGSSAVGEVVDV